MESNNHSSLFSAAKAAFPHTIPVMAGYIFLGISYGIYANVAGLSFIYPTLMGIFIFGGSLEFLAVFFPLFFFPEREKPRNL